MFLSQMGGGCNNQTSCFIIAEIGVNHNGDIDLSKKLIDSAKRAGADAVKFQTYFSEEIVTPACEKPQYQRRSPETTQYEMLKRLELSFDDFTEIKRYCDTCNVEFISTPYSPSSAYFLDNLGVKRFKIASADIINKPLLTAVGKLEKQIILSVGMASVCEIERTIKYLNKIGATDICILHCTTSYPTAYEDVNMQFMRTLKALFNYPIGYSDHTPGIEIPIMAVSMGATIVEKHFTLDRAFEGPDHFASLESDEFAQMVQSIRNVEKAVGNGQKMLAEEERRNRNKMRRSIHASRDISLDETFSLENIKVTRPYDGISSWDANSVIGKRAKRNVRKDQAITWEDIQ